MTTSSWGSGGFSVGEDFSLTPFQRGNGKGSYISAANLLLEYRHFIDSHASLSRINEVHLVWPSLVNYCKEIESYPDLMKAITALHAKSQIDFERALFCSWMSLVLSKYQNLAEVHQRSLFLAGLFQDLGKHSVDDEVKEVVSKVNGLGTLQVSSQCADAHPLLSSTFVERILDDSSVSDLVLHHHARYDGTGYPKHLYESQLDIDHQILIIANEISDYLDSVGGHNQLDKCLPMLHVGSLMHFGKAYSAWYDLLSSLFDVPTDYEDLERTNLVLQARKCKLEKLLASLISLSGELLRYDFDLNIHGLRLLIQKLAGVFTDTGVLNQNIFKPGDASCIVVLKEMNLIFKGVPFVLERCKDFIHELKLANKFDINSVLLTDIERLLASNISDLGGRKASIFQ